MLALTSSRLKVFVLLAILACVCYGNLLDGPLFFDDEFFIQRNETIHSLKNIPQIYLSTASTEEGSNFYRPNAQLLHAITYHFFKLNPVPYHALPIILHLLNAFFIYILLLKLAFSNKVSFISSIIFLIHPIQTEAISSSSGLHNPLGLFFLLLGITQFIKSLLTEDRRQKTIYTIWCSLLYIMALLSRESMIVCLPLSVIIALYVLSKNTKKATKHLFVSLFLFTSIVLVYLFLKFTVFNFTASVGLTTAKNLYTENLAVRLITFVNILWEYAKMIFYPLHLYYEKPYLAYTTLVSLRALFGMLLIVGFTLTAVFFKKYKKIFLGLGWFFASLLPYTGIIPLNAMYLEHWLYTPLIGILILFASLYTHFENSKFEKILIIILVPICLIFMTKTIARNSQWADVEKFYINELRYTNSSRRIYNNLGMYYAEKKYYKKAITQYTRAIQMGDSYPQPHHNLANIYYETGEAEKALEELHNALRINPNFLYSLTQLYTIYLEYHQMEKLKETQKSITNLRIGGKNTLKDIEKLF